MNVYQQTQTALPVNAASDLVALPSESFVSSLWRFAWRNGLGPAELLTYCSTARSYFRDGSGGVTRNWFDPEHFAETSGWFSSDEMSIVEQKEVSRNWWTRTFRYCPICLEQGYHSFWHQCSFFTHCPVDGAALEAQCYLCRKHLPRYGFFEELFRSPYTCPHCDGPIAGVQVTVASRLAIQERWAELDNIFVKVRSWWTALTPRRVEFEDLIRDSFYDRSGRSVKSAANVRHWLVSTSDSYELPFGSRALPRLITLKWTVRLNADDPNAWIWKRRKSKDERLALAQQVYRASLRRLQNLINASFPYSEEEYRRHLMLPVEDMQTIPQRCNLHLLALCYLRRTYETYSSLMYWPVASVQLDPAMVDHPLDISYAERIRICWRAKFIAEYATVYWWLVASHGGRRNDNRFRRSDATMASSNVTHDSVNGDIVTGIVAFPAIEGLELGLA